MPQHANSNTQIIQNSRGDPRRPSSNARMGLSCGRKENIRAQNIDGFIIPQNINERDPEICYDPVFGTLCSTPHCIELIKSTFAIYYKHDWREPGNHQVRYAIGLSIKEGVVPNLRIARTHTLADHKAGTQLVNPTLVRTWLKRRSQKWQLKSKVKVVPFPKPTLIQNLKSFFKNLFK